MNYPKVIQKLVRNNIPKLGIYIVILLLFYLLALGVSNYIKIFLGNNDTTSNNKIILETFSQISFYAILSVGIIYILVKLGFNLNTILVLIGSAGLAIALALQNSITNVASGFIILFLQYYDIGDLIEINNTLGHVDSFNLFNTTIKDLDDVSTNIPNTTIVNGALTNYYKNKDMHLSFFVTISNYDNSININDLSSKIVNELQNNCTYVTDKDNVKVKIYDLSKEGTKIKVVVPIESKNYINAKYMAQEIVRELMRINNVYLIDYYYKEDGSKK